MGREFHLGLIGYPIEHSLSPVLQNAALLAGAFSGDYRLFPVFDLPQGEEPLKSIVERIRRGDLDGVNVTIPHKQNVLKILDELSPTARAIGAVNTIYKKDGILYGENTDVGGFMNDLMRVGVVRNSGSTALVLGAGGAARAVVWGLLTGGWHVRIMARRLEQAQQIMDWVNRSSLDEFSSNIERVSAHHLDPKNIQKLVSIETISLIVNTTPLGMTSHPQGTPWPTAVPLPKSAALYDLVYSPPETELMKLAHESGNPAYNGLGMLLEQAALAFEIWTGAYADRDAMWMAVNSIQENK